MKKATFVPLEKRSKRAQREEHKKQRNSWGNVCPATRIIPDKRRSTRGRERDWYCEE